MLDLEFINTVRENTKTAIANKEVAYDESILAHTQSEHFQQILTQIETASHEGLYKINLIANKVDGLALTMLDIDCLKEMGFTVEYTMERFTGSFMSMFVSWEETVVV